MFTLGTDISASINKGGHIHSIWSLEFVVEERCDPQSASVLLVCAIRNFCTSHSPGVEGQLAIACSMAINLMFQFPHSLRIIPQWWSRE